MSIFKSLKVAKRRGVETILQAIGASDAAVDEEFKQFELLLRALSEDTNEVGAALSAYLTSQKQHIAIASELGEVLLRLYQSEGASNEGTHGMNLRDVSIMLQGLWSDIHGNYRPSAAKVLKDFAIDPLRQCVTVSIPEVEGMCSEREQFAKDCGSYKRRLAKLEQRTTLTETEQAEKAKLEGKLVTAEQQFEHANNRTKQEIARLKVVRDSMVELSIVYLAVCQADFYERSAARFKELLATLPQDRVQHARGQINNYVRQGGPPRQEAELSNAQKAWMVASGKALPSDFQKSEEQQEQELMQAAQARERAVQIVAEDQTGVTRATPAPPAPPAPRTPAAPSAPASLPVSPVVKPSAVKASQAKATPAPSKAAPAKTSASKAAPAASSSSSPSSSSAPVLRRWMSNNTSSDNSSGAGGVTSKTPVAIPSNAVQKWPPQQASGSTPQPPAPPAAKAAPVTPAPAPPAPIVAPPAPAPPPPRPKVLKRVKALYANEPDDDDELGFDAGDTIDVLEELDPGWWRGACKGKEGIFPTNYVEVIP